MSCECDMSHLARPPETSIKSYEVQMMTGVTEKARMFPGAFVIQIDREWWATLSVPERTAVLAHEMAHDENPTACEVCTDARAGARMRHEGVSRAQAVSAIARMVKMRRATGDFDPSAVGDGWDAADAWIEDAGDQVPPSALWSYTGNLDETVERADVDEARGLDDDGGQSLIEDDPNGQSIDPTIGIGAPTTPTTPRPTPPAPKPAASSSNAMLMIGVAVVIVAIVMLSKKS